MKNGEGLHIKIVGSVSFWKKLISCVSSIAHVLLTVFFGYIISALLSGRPVIDPLIFVFAATSKLFAIFLTEDGNASRKWRVYSTMALASLSSLLIGLTTFEIIMGVLILMLYALYPLVSGRAPFDVIHHVLRYVLIFVLGYGSQAVFNETALFAILAVMLFSLAGELLAGIGRNSGTSKDAASLLSIKRSLVMIAFSIFIASLLTALVFNDLFEFPIQINETFFPFYVIPALVVDLFLTMPLMKALNGKHVDPFHLMRRKELVIMLVVSLSILVVFQTGRVSSVIAVNSRDYSFDVGIRTFIAGPHSWDVPWIVFNYVNKNNYYYLVFHTDGALELSQDINGTTLKYESSLKTQLTPFQWHNFHISLNETTVTVILDGEYQMSAARHLVSDPSSVIISPSILHPTGLWVASIYSISINP